MRKLLKGQMWYFDLVIALTIFTLIIILSFKYISETFMYEDSDIIDDIESFSDTLMSEGRPYDWNESYVISIGLSTNNSLDTRKLSLFSNMTILDYDDMKDRLSLRNDFLVILEKEISNVSIIGYPNYNYTNATDLEVDEFAELTRFLPYRHDSIAEIVSIKIVMWDAKES